MKFSFALSETEPEERRTLSPFTSKEEQLEWVPLQKHPVFSASINDGAGAVSSSPALSNLIAWDGASRLYLWDSNKCYLHRFSIRLGDPEPTSVVAASSSKVLQPDIQVDFVVNNISINRNGSAMLLEGSNGLCVMYLYGRTSTKDNTIICRTVKLGSGIYFDSNSSVRTLQVLWHPYTDTHLGILSSDSVFRLFDLSSNLEQPEQEYYLQPVEPGRCYNTGSICPVGFSFGGEHLWDRFSVFVLFADGSVYILCPVVPFGSVYRWESIVEIYNDAQTFGLKSSNSRAVSNSSIAIAWLEATFPELTHQDLEGGTISALKAHPYAQFDVSLSLQGPLRKLCHGGEEDDSEGQGANCEGRAVDFLYNSVSKDSILVTAWSSGQLQIDALADEIHPAWNVGSRPRFCVDSRDHICGLAMICDSNPDEPSVVKLDQPLDDTLWLGHPPPLLRLAVVDLALPKIGDYDNLLKMFIDPLIPERIYCVHRGGVDSIVLHFLPFTSQTSGKDETMRAPSVQPILGTCRGVSSSPPLCGLVALADSVGYSWILGVTFSQECILVEMKSWDVLLPHHIDVGKKPGSSEELPEIDPPDIISKELLSGPKVDIIPQVSPNLRLMASDSIEGRSTLNQYFKLFNENYVEYAHKVFFELKHHATQLKKIIDDQHVRVTEAKKKLLKVEEKQPSLEDRLNHAIQVHEHLEERLQGLRDLPGVRKKPLSRAERQFKSELDRFAGLELDALHSSIEALNGRLRRYSHSPQGNASNSARRQLASRRKPHLPDAQIAHLRSSIEKLSLINDENTKKVKLVESALKSRKTTDG
ncbi:nuclear pore complex protein NUP88 [Macadamia integrifolia]|uniref:nuclear pore complex protein NUP88 n=1 Tax=Macadamia integrifolia TaxID=60698 RepID=UPI001C4F3DB3|nr:nuclear pore complex protein NUP88 [Macadamia integrifolia]